MRMDWISSQIKDRYIISAIVALFLIPFIIFILKLITN